MRPPPALHGPNAIACACLRMTHRPLDSNVVGRPPHRACWSPETSAIPRQTRTPEYLMFPRCNTHTAWTPPLHGAKNTSTKLTCHKPNLPRTNIDIVSSAACTSLSHILGSHVIVQSSRSEYCLLVYQAIYVDNNYEELCIKESKIREAVKILYWSHRSYNC